MADKLEQLIRMERDWQDDRPSLKRNNNDPERIAKALREEVTELIQAITCFSLDAGDLKEVAQECADVCKYLLAICIIFNIDLFSEVMEKHAYNMVRFPANAFGVETDYEDAYWGQKHVVKRDKMKEHFYA